MIIIDTHLVLDIETSMGDTRKRIRKVYVAFGLNDTERYFLEIDEGKRPIIKEITEGEFKTMNGDLLYTSNL